MRRITSGSQTCYPPCAQADKDGKGHLSYRMFSFFCFCSSSRAPSPVYDACRNIALRNDGMECSSPLTNCKCSLTYYFRTVGRIFRHRSSKPFYGTGSYPLPPQGWQRRIRFTPSQPPRITPYFITASIIYWLQVGVYRHEGGVRGDMHAR